MSNQNPEQIARDHIDKQLTACGWLIQGKPKINMNDLQVKYFIPNSFHIDRDDFDLSPFIANSALTKIWNMFGNQSDANINKLNNAFVG
jgi:hypothetical protein